MATHIIGLPSGIGDVMWALGKLAHAGPQRYRIADGWPYRTVPWIKMLGPSVVAAHPTKPGELDVTYGQFGYQEICVFESAQGIVSGTRWADLDCQEWGQLLLEPNQHLEAGRPLVDWLPDLPTSYHLPMHVPAEDEVRAAQLTAGLPRPLTAISCASYRGAEAWHTWGYDEWSPFLRRLQAELGGTILLLGGHWDDLTSRIAAQDGYPDLVGKTNVPQLVAVLRRCDHCVGFSSGLGMLHAAEWGKTFLLWPEHQVELSRSWADPAMLDAGTYETSMWRQPDEVWWVVKRWLGRAGHREREAIQQ